MSFELPDLPFEYDALQPHMSADTLRYHHGKHHKAYVDKLNKAVEGTSYAELALEEVIQKSAEQQSDKGVFNNAGQHWNHSFFWHCMAPGGGGQPDGELARQIEADFGGLEAFASRFVKAATGRFGSGWAWLVLDNGKLEVLSTPNAEPPMLQGKQALLTCDVWEHAYYLDYQNRRAEFVETFLKQLVNWDFVAERYSLQGEGNTAAARRFREGQQRFSASGEVDRSARAARDAIEGDEAEELEEARRTAAGSKR